ncbi:hypothetical protein BDY19DRAFT_997915 [Irpex rosettiformis]|uniref:Uncharacterized protein n=1 Tax=Irpex rosettiformis TaxID=378272 RepID=A0ACB8TQ81_9APHY|nr:hypothetical protein BDY19DRAFT_997915 [Irpex rosettiformis]
MGRSATIYAEQLSERGYGHPLWFPEPTKGLDGHFRDPQLGDVGYIDEDGGFRRLFNVTVGPEHELNAGGVPDGFVPINFKQELADVKERFLAPGPLCSGSIKVHVAEASATANVAGTAEAGISFTFRLTDDRGALLMLGDHATKASISAGKIFEKYMLKHHKSWYHFATDTEKLGINCEYQDIVLVRGTIKTSAWTVAAFLNKTDHVYELTVGGQLPPAAGVGLTIRSEHASYPTCEQRSGPYRSQAALQAAEPSSPSLLTGTDATQPGVSFSPPHTQADEPSKDQCVFLDHYKIKYNPLGILSRIMKAKAEDKDPPTGEDPGNSEGDTAIAMEVDVVIENAYNPPRTPLDDILDYILSNSDAEAAIASYEDMQYLLPEIWPGYISGFEQKYAYTHRSSGMTRAKIVTQVAGVMRGFFEYVKYTHTTEPQWSLGPEGRIKFEDIYLVELRQVSKATFQPILAYKPRDASTTFAQEESFSMPLSSSAQKRSVVIRSESDNELSSTDKLESLLFDF